MKRKKKLVVVGGSSGLGASFIVNLQDMFDEILDIDIKKYDDSFGFSNKVSYIKFDLAYDNVAELKKLIVDADFLILTAGIGKVRNFYNYSIGEIKRTLDVNLSSLLQILCLFFPTMIEKEKKCLVVSSIAGCLVSPLFVPYSASKSGLSSACKALNIELEKYNSKSVITYLEPLKIEGTSFCGKDTNIDELKEFTLLVLKMVDSKIKHSFCSETAKNVFESSQKNPNFGYESFDYKIANSRLESSPSRIGYLSGTFDLFHVGHLNLIRRAKEHCDYLVVGIHPSGKWKGKETFVSLEDRISILKSIKYIDDVIIAPDEDSDAYDIVKYNYLFVGSDYKGSPRFENYEKILANKAKIIYFDYTTSVSSTKLREEIKKCQ